MLSVSNTDADDSTYFRQVLVLHKIAVTQHSSSLVHRLQPVGPSHELDHVASSLLRSPRGATRTAINALYRNPNQRGEKGIYSIDIVR
ncbi:unnamed protein product [Jaminaea pallidilutea]